MAVTHEFKILLLIKTVKEDICLVWFTSCLKLLCCDALPNFKLVNLLESFITTEFDIVHKAVVWVIQHHVNLSLAVRQLRNLILMGSLRLFQGFLLRVLSF
jgi:hypothetical protein